MSEYLFLYRGGDQGVAELSPEQLQQRTMKWASWIKGLAENGHLKDMGQPLEGGGAVAYANGVVTDGPFAEAKDLIGGYTIVLADSLAEATALTAGCPGFDFGGCVEVRPVRKISM